MKFIPMWSFFDYKDSQGHLEIVVGPVKFNQDEIEGFRTWSYSFISCGLGVDFCKSKYYSTYTLRLIGFAIEFRENNTRLKLVKCQENSKL